MKPEGQDQQATPQKTNIQQIFQKSVEGLLYPSESDYPFTYFEWGAARQETITEEDVLALTGNAADKQVQIISLDKFFDQATQIQDWYGDEEKENAERFATLKATLQENLTDIQVFKIGNIEIQVFIAGKTKDGTWAGISTTVVET